MYTISEYSYQQAKRLGVTIKPSINKKKKIDVYKDDKKIASIGAMGYYDYPTYLKEQGKDYANRKRLAYKKRHDKDRHVKGTPGYYADQILW